ncbi:sensor histidine kinase [Albibacterium indicum]|uniref:sensor histidine kinase n=1 Tax=Albibacterium indicum TaxID=2292082 RepID=UPI000E4EEA73|nr:histidine kinase [Pedobacter indicus]
MLSKINHITPDILLNRQYRPLRHVLLQIAVLLITVNILWDKPTQILPSRLWAWGIYWLLFNLAIYINMYVLVPRFLLKGKTKLYVGLTFLLILLSILSIGVLQSLADGESATTAPTRAPVFIGLLSGLGSFALFIGGITNLQLFKYLLENRQRINELENATMAVELANLQNQINPHFLFNMLNNANIMAGEDTQKSSLMLSKLKDLLRYQVDKSSEKTVRLDQEIALLKDYLELETVRRDRFSYDIKFWGDMSQSVPPLLFIPFVENAVKHNPENDAYVHLLFRLTADKLYFECINPKAKTTRTRKEGGIGLVNIRRRLDLLYKQKYELVLKDNGSFYTAKLELEL